MFHGFSLVGINGKMSQLIGIKQKYEKNDEQIYLDCFE
jgi:hypothetical protein